MQTCAWRDLTRIMPRFAATSGTSMSISIWEPGRPAGQPVSQKPLRTGDRIEIGDWTLSYFREEFADHGIPGGGRHGGDQHPVQEEPRPRGTSPEGGSDRTADDPGEYF